MLVIEVDFMLEKRIKKIMQKTIEIIYWSLQRLALKGGENENQGL